KIEAQREAEEKAQRDAEEKAQREADEKTKIEAQREAEEKAQRDAEEKAQREADEKTKIEAQREAEEKAQRDAEEKAQREADEKTKIEAQREAEEKAQNDACNQKIIDIKGKYNTLGNLEYFCKMDSKNFDQNAFITEVKKINLKSVIHGLNNNDITFNISSITSINSNSKTYGLDMLEKLIEILINKKEEGACKKSILDNLLKKFTHLKSIIETDDWKTFCMLNSNDFSSNFATLFNDKNIYKIRWSLMR
ncbi:hypothetical protein QKU58_gp026, partial [Pyramimonas orientalis virus]